MNWGWLDRNLDTVLEDLQEHVQIALVALVLGRRSSRSRSA